MLDIKNKEHHCEEFNYLELENIKFELLIIENDLSKLIDLEFAKIAELKDDYILLNKMIKIKNSKNKSVNKKSLQLRINMSKFKSVKDIENVKLLLPEGYNSKYIAELYEVDASTINDIKKR